MPSLGLALRVASMLVQRLDDYLVHAEDGSAVVLFDVFPVPELVLVNKLLDVRALRYLKVIGLDASVHNDIMQSAGRDSVRVFQQSLAYVLDHFLQHFFLVSWRLQLETQVDELLCR